MARLTPCPSCHAHVFVDDRRCHHCGASLRTTTAAPIVTTMLLGLALAGCPSDKEDDTGATTHESQDGTQGTTAGTMGTDNGTTTADSISGSGGVEYGTPDTGIEDATATATASDSTGTGTDGTAGSDEVGEPEYGVPGTTTGTGTGTG